MFTRLFRLLVVSVCALLLLAVCSTAAEARGGRHSLARVSGVQRTSVDARHARLKISWHPVAGARRYQMRVAVSVPRLRHSHLIRTRTAGGTFTRPLARGRTYVVQVRAVRRHHKGAWSRPSRVRLGSSPSDVTVVPPVTPPPNGGPSGTVFGMNVSVGSSFTNGARETAADQVNRIVRTYGSLGAAKIFYSGMLPTTFNRNYEGLVPGKTVAVCFKANQVAMANGAYDAAIDRYISSIPSGWKVMLVNWQEPDDEMWKDHVFTVAQHRAATDRLIDVAHANPAYRAGRVQVWDVYMGGSLYMGRWQDSAPSPRLDGIGWDYYWNHPTTDWNTDPNLALRKMVDVNRRLGIPHNGLFETGDNPHPNDPSGAGRAAFWNRVYSDAANLGYDYVLYFNAIGTTGDHRIRPDTAFGASTASVLRGYMS